MKRMAAVFQCILSVALFIAALGIAAFAIYVSWRGALLIITFEPIPVIAGFILVCLSLFVGGYLALITGLQALLRVAVAYDYLGYGRDTASHSDKENEIKIWLSLTVVTLVITILVYVPGAFELFKLGIRYIFRKS